MQISTEHYQKEHYKNGKANAFRHALWNYLIANYCAQWSKNREKTVQWTKDITDWHELAFPNGALAQKMDFHNNAIGRSLFVAYEDTSVAVVIQELKNKTNESLLIDLSTDQNVYREKLVHIEK